MEKKNPGVFRASCLYLLAGIGLWAVGLAVQLLSAPLSRMNTFALMLLVSVACYFPFVLFPTIAAVWNAPDALRLVLVFRVRLRARRAPESDSTARRPPSSRRTPVRP